MLTKDQKVAIDTVELAFGKGHREAALTGWAGTGKTYTTARIVERLQGYGKVHVLAPTHRACSVLRQEFDQAGVFVPVDTVHAGCGLIPCKKTQGVKEAGKARADEADYIIVDEASMIDGKLLARIRQLPAKRILFVGDPYQLSPVSEARGTPAFSDDTPTARLTETKRYAPGSVLDKLTAHLRDCIDTRKKPNIGKIREVMQFVDGGFEKAGELYREKEGIVLGFTNRAAFEACFAVQGGAEYCFRDGDPVVFIEQWNPSKDFSDRIYNGTEATIEKQDFVHESIIKLHLKFSTGGRAEVYSYRADEMVFWMDLKKQISARYRCTREQWEQFKKRNPIVESLGGSDHARGKLDQINRFAFLRQTYATTCHKAQGGSYDRVIVLWDDLMKARDPEMLARLLYVAATRVRSAEELFFVRGAK